MKSDVIVIGAGVQGCAVALRLAQAGQSVLVLERSVPGAEASSAAAGILSPGVEAEEPGPFYQLCAASLARYRAFAAELERLTGVSVGYRGGGTLQVAFDDVTARALAGRARADRPVLCGSTMEEVGYERGVTAGGLRGVLDLAIEIAPALAGAPLIDSWSSFRPASPDGWPVRGASAVPGLYYATGHTRNGILLCPITADAVSAAILGRPAPVDLSPFSVARLRPTR